MHAFHLGNELARAGWEVAVAVPSMPDRVRELGEPAFECLTHSEVRRRYRRRDRDLLIHAWTPRECVRRLTERVARHTRAPYVVHLEDNEERLLAATTGRPYGELETLPRRNQDRIVPSWRAHPARYPRFLAAARGLTMVTEELNDFNRAARPYHLTRPGVDPGEFTVEGDRRRRRALGLRPDEFVIVYHGNVHEANRSEVLSLYLAVRVLQRRGHPVRLVRLGRDVASGPDPAFAALRDGAIELGERPRRELPEYLRIADAFVQPGSIDDFNRYRLPSKVPEFLAMGRPVILPACNIGLELRDGENALLLREGTALETADHLELLLADPDLRARLGRGARAFAVERLEWSRRAAGLGEFLARMLTARS